jgi:hypothetical protein
MASRAGPYTVAPVACTQGFHATDMIAMVVRD